MNLEDFQRKQNNVLKQDMKQLQADNAALQERIDVLERIDALQAEAPPWKVASTAKGKLHEAMPVLLLSDTHFDEIVKPDEVEGVNQYNRQIAVKRLKRILSGSVEMARTHLANLKYDGFTLMLGGDIFSGSIHEELEQTNEDTVLGSLDYWADQLLAFITALADEFGHVHIAGVVGNHGRLTRKPRAKLRVRDNLDWFLYRILARSLANDGRITWQIPESADCMVPIYGTQIRLTHGDQFRGGSGISGMMSPIMLGQHRKSRRQASLQKPFDWLVMGHWHQYICGRGLLVNGSLKGYDEYAYVSNFDFERPQQAFFVVTPKNGLTFPLSIFAED